LNHEEHEVHEEIQGESISRKFRRLAACPPESGNGHRNGGPQFL